MGPRTVFLYEFITAGGWHHVASGPPDGSLLAEGRAMLEAIATDFAALDNVSVNLMWDTRLERPPAGQIEIAKVCSADEELKTFASLASNCECTLIIAPEIDNWLSSKTRTAQELDALLLGPNVNFVEITSDKSLTAERLRSAGVPTPRTVRYRPGNPLPSELGERLIVKPNDGAGSTDVRKLTQAIWKLTFRVTVSIAFKNSARGVPRVWPRFVESMIGSCSPPAGNQSNQQPFATKAVELSKSNRSKTA